MSNNRSKVVMPPEILLYKIDQVAWLASNSCTTFYSSPTEFVEIEPLPQLEKGEYPKEL
jgi:hypothetical protein